MSMEAGVVLDSQGQPIFWHVPPDRSVGYLPDNRSLWDVLWENRDNLLGFAHSHPGEGLPGPSHEDVTTFAAVEAALGKRLKWYIISRTGLVVCEWRGPHRLTYSVEPILSAPAWLERLREVSYNIG